MQDGFWHIVTTQLMLGKEGRWKGEKERSEREVGRKEREKERAKKEGERENKSKSKEGDVFSCPLNHHRQRPLPTEDTGVEKRASQGFRQTS